MQLISCIYQKIFIGIVSMKKCLYRGSNEILQSINAIFLHISLHLNKKIIFLEKQLLQLFELADDDS